MSLRELARPLLASWFVYGGINTFLEPEASTRRSAPVLEPAIKEAGLELEVRDVVRAHGAATAVAGAIFALSRTPRTSALALSALAAGTVAAGRPFWREENAAVRKAELERFVMNVSLFGGVLLASTAGRSKPKKKVTKKAATAKRNGAK